MTVNIEQSIPEPSVVWPKAAWQITKSACKTAYYVANSPPVLLGIGNVLWTATNAEVTGVAINVAATLAAMGAATYESLTGRNMGLPYYYRGVSCLVTAISIGYNGWFSGSLKTKDLEDLGKAAREVLLPASTFLISAYGNFVHARHEKKKTKPKAYWNDPYFYMGLCEIPAMLSLQGVSLALLPILVGFTGTFTRKPTVSKETKPTLNLAVKHVTSARLYALGWGMGAAATAFSSPELALVQAFWAAGFARFDPEKNQELLPDIRKTLKLKIQQARRLIR